MKKLFAVATLVGAASGTAVAVSSTTEVASNAAPVAVAPAQVAIVVAIEPIAEPNPVQSVLPVDQIAIKPLALGNGWPACGNVVSKAGYMPQEPCPTTAQRTVDVVLQLVVTGVQPKAPL